MPNRVLRDWTTSEAIDRLSPGAEVFFTRLIMKADDYGNYTANAKLLNAALFPLRKYSLSKIEQWTVECIACGAVVPYTVDGKRFLSIPNFGQRLRTMQGKFPQPPSVSNPPSIDRQLSDNGRPETKRNEEETEGETKRGEISLSEFQGLFDEIWKEQIALMPVHKGKNLDECIQKAYLHLQAGGRLLRGTTQDFKQCVQSFLNNEKPNGQQKPRTKSFELKNI